MSRQIAVRLPEDVVEFIDCQVRERRVASRAAFVQAALDRERRRLIAARDAQILSQPGVAPDDFDSLATYARGLKIELE